MDRVYSLGDTEKPPAGDRIGDRVATSNEAESLTESEVAQILPAVARIESELATARTKLKWAQRGLDTVDNVNESVSDMQDAAREALDDDRG